MTRLAGKSALITGAARGIGWPLPAPMPPKGARVAIADIDIARARDAAAAIGDAARAVELDVTKQESIDAAVAETVTAFGQIDILINNAAVFTAAPITEITREDFARTFDINVSGTLFMMQAVARHMIARWRERRQDHQHGKPGGAARRAAGRGLLRDEGGRHLLTQSAG
jgi:NAD(P)-dependent dehydrogenase (short-subunit alcohol dehydrogenase family)